MSVSRKITFITLTLISIAYIAARFWRLTDSCLWFDEIFSVHAAEHPWNELFWFVALDLIHPPLFYVRLKLWMDIVGDDVFWLRLLPVIISCIAIIPFLFLCRELKLKTWVTALALFFLAVNGSLIKYAEEVRMYSLLMCLSLFSMWLFARYFNRGKSLVFLLIVNILLVYSHYFGWYVVAAEVAAILILQCAKWRPIVAMFGVVFASFLPWMIAVWRAAQSGSALGQNIGWMSRPGIGEIGTFVFDLIEPFYYQASSAESASVWSVSVPILLIILIALVLYLINWNQRTDEEKQTIYFLLIFAGLPIAAAFIVSWLLPYSIWGTRHLIVVFAPIAILLALAITKVEPRWLKVGALTLLVLFSGYAFVVRETRQTQSHVWCGWGELATEIADSEPAPIYVFEDLAAYHVWFAIRNTTPQLHVKKVEGMEDMTEDPAYFLPRGFDDVGKVTMSNFSEGRIWLLFRADEWNIEKPPLSTFISQGYQITRIRRREYVGSKMFAVMLMSSSDEAYARLTNATALLGLKGDCWTAAPLDCTDYAGFLEDLYEKGDGSTLDPLLDAGTKADGALAETLGPFYGDRLVGETETFITKLAERSRDEQENLCFLAIGGDGSGHGEHWESAVRAKLRLIKQQNNDQIKRVADVCLAQMSRFDTAINNRERGPLPSR